MIKQDLIQRVVERTGLPRTKAEDAVDAIFDSMKKTLIAGDRIELRGFGVFTVKPRKTGIGRNPRTGAEVSSEPGKAVRFMPGTELHLMDEPAAWPFSFFLSPRFLGEVILFVADRGWMCD